MRRSTFKGLLLLNGLLLISLLLVTFSPEAMAQRRVNRPRGEYTMVAARTQGFSEAAIYVVDSSNQEMLVVRYNRSVRNLEYVGFRDLAADARAAAGGANR